MHIDLIKNKNNNKIFKIFIIFLFFNYNFNIISKLNFFLSYIKIHYEIKKVDNYYIFCNNNKLLKKFKKKNNPKISIISPIYNRQSFILRFLTSIQYQNFDDLEIILVDDCSSDKSIEKIKEYQIQDERIILIKNKKNKGTFITRNIGALYSKGKYLIIPDPDDIITENILTICYNYAEKYKYEMIRFKKYTRNRNIFFDDNENEYENKILKQPEISTYIFYANNELRITDFFIYNKFIKKDAYIRGLNLIKKFYLNIYMTMDEDQVINYILHRTVKSFYYLKKIGYRYIINRLSITKIIHKVDKRKLKFIFYHLKIIFEYSKNIKYEKDMVNLLLNNLNNYLIIVSQLSLLNKEDFHFYYNIINNYLNCIFITNENKYMLNEFKNIFEKKPIHS